jgi:hypothetical protein
MSFESVHFVIGETNMTHCETFEGNLASMEERNKAWFVQCSPFSPQDAVFPAHFILIQQNASKKGDAGKWVPPWPAKEPPCIITPKVL